MQHAIRHRKIRLLAYDDSHPRYWSLPPVSPGPSPLALRPTFFRPPLRKIHLLPLAFQQGTIGDKRGDTLEEKH